MDGVINFEDIKKEKARKELEAQGIQVYEFDLNQIDDMEILCTLLKQTMLSIYGEPEGEVHIYVENEEYVFRNKDGEEIIIEEPEEEEGFDMFLEAYTEDEEYNDEYGDEDLVVTDLLRLHPAKIYVHGEDCFSREGFMILQFIFGAKNVILE